MVVSTPPWEVQTCSLLINVPHPSFWFSKWRTSHLSSNSQQSQPVRSPTKHFQHSSVPESNPDRLGSDGKPSTRTRNLNLQPYSSLWGEAVTSAIWCRGGVCSCLGAIRNTLRRWNPSSAKVTVFFTSARREPKWWRGYVRVAASVWLAASQTLLTRQGKGQTSRAVSTAWSWEFYLISINFVFKIREQINHSTGCCNKRQWVTVTSRRCITSHSKHHSCTTSGAARGHFLCTNVLIFVPKKNHHRGQNTRRLRGLLTSLHVNGYDVSEPFWDGSGPLWSWL